MASTNIKRVTLDIEKAKTQKEDDLFYFVENKTVNSEKITAPRYSYWKSVSRIFFKKKSNWIFLGLIGIVLIMTYIFPLFIDYNQMENVSNSTMFNKSPGEMIEKYGFSLKWIFGSGTFGDSIFYGIWASARISLSIAFAAAIINMALGIAIGALWGYSKRLDTILNFVYNIIYNIPYLLLMTVLVYVFGSGIPQFILALTIVGWLGIAYVFRTQVLIIRDREYNLASRCLGTPTTKVVSKNVLPYLTSVIMTILAAEIPAYVSTEVTLSYLGIGLSAEVPSLGRMITLGQISWTVYPWEFWPPIAVSSIITIVLYVLGQSLADASDPRTHMQ